MIDRTVGEEIVQGRYIIQLRMFRIEMKGLGSNKELEDPKQWLAEKGKPVKAKADQKTFMRLNA